MGWSVPQIARHLGITESRVRHWVKTFPSGGEVLAKNGLSYKPTTRAVGQKQKPEEVAAWQVTRGERSWQQRLVREGHTGKAHEAGVLAAKAQHSDLPSLPLGLVVSRPRQAKPARKP